MDLKRIHGNREHQALKGNSRVHKQLGNNNSSKMGTTRQGLQQHQYLISESATCRQALTMSVLQ
jgi:hypothetical protein